MSLDDFYTYISNNYEQTRYEVLKNVTYDEELFDDVYNDTVIKVADIIMQGKEIEDIRYYFFISLKWNYINAQNKKRKERNMLSNAALQSNVERTNELRDVADTDTYSEERYEKVMELWDYISKRLEKEFNPAEVDIYLIYYKLKCSGRSLSYRKLSDITGIPVKEITNIIQRIKHMVRNDEEINEMKKKLLK